MIERQIKLDGAYNVRDIGGYRTEDNRTVRWSRLLRGDNLRDPSRHDWNLLSERGLNAVIDLRDESATREVPSVFASRKGVQYQNIELITNKLDSQAENAGLRGMSGYYIFLLERAKTEFRAVLEAVCAAVGNGCTLIHCNAGKDRTGLITALVLRSLRVPIDTIAEDYALSSQYLQPLLEKYKQDAAARGVDEGTVLRGWAARPEAMEETMAHIERDYGDVAGYVASLGLPSDFTADLSRAMLI
jgi:protein-tyrosine phosphatase